MCRVPETGERPYHHGHLRAGLLQAAERRLREDGVDGLSLRDLARELGVSHAAPRRHFPDRRALLDALAETGFARLDTVLRAALADTADDFAVRLQAVATAYTRFATENAALLELMFRSKHRPGGERVARAAEGAFALVNELIVQGQAEGALQAGEPEQAGLILFATLQGIAALVNGDVVPPEMRDGLVETATEQFLRGARPLP
ncbi:TetR family transcriptional regulator [Actinomadura rayongensis]|uniref:TetR family transcriptional regulator n=1 Tax=Actinomadura rayongensis TaxID=1429076 RepID=A0A6I4WHS2_9ACTN|nr:TetR family transcriptional regulator [Actinomadura rayongensis]